MAKRHEIPVDEYGFKRNNTDVWGYDSSREQRDEKSLITEGKWIMIIKTLPVNACVRPQLYGIYWAVPFTREGKAAIKDKINI